MRIQIIAVGTKMPEWVETGCAHFLKRFPSDMPVKFVGDLYQPLPHQRHHAEHRSGHQSHAK